MRRTQHPLRPEDRIIIVRALQNLARLAAHVAKERTNATAPKHRRTAERAHALAMQFSSVTAYTTED